MSILCLLTFLSGNRFSLNDTKVLLRVYEYNFKDPLISINFKEPLLLVINFSVILLMMFSFVACDISQDLWTIQLFFIFLMFLYDLGLGLFTPRVDHILLELCLSSEGLSSLGLKDLPFYVCEMIFYFGYNWLDMRLILFETTNIWDQEYGQMVQLESKGFIFLVLSFPSLLFWPLLFISFCICNLLRYKWMTYGEAGTSRSAVGSGLIYHGISKVSHRVVCWPFNFFPPFASLFFCLLSPHCLQLVYTLESICKFC